MPMVLLIEDNATSRRILAGMLKHWGVEPVAAETSQQALERLGTAERFDAAIIDLQMPELDGRALARRIRELPARAALPLVLLANAGRKEDPAGHFRAILTKPAKPAQVFDALLAIFAKRGGNPASVPPS